MLERGERSVDSKPLEIARERISLGGSEHAAWKGGKRANSLGGASTGNPRDSLRRAPLGGSDTNNAEWLPRIFQDKFHQCDCPEKLCKIKNKKLCCVPPCFWVLCPTLFLRFSYGIVISFVDKFLVSRIANLYSPPAR